MARRRISFRRSILASLAIAASIPFVSAQTYYFTGAVTVQQAGSGGGYSPAQQAQCPHGYDNRCDAIGASDYCCPASDTCSWSNSQVMCCAAGQTCSGYGSGAGAYQPTSYYAPATQSTVYYQPTSQYAPPPATTVYAAGGGVVGGQQQSQPPVYGGYCSTYYAQGPNLPTTIQGDCGTVLVVDPGQQQVAGAVRWAMGWVRLVGSLLALNLVGGVLFVWR